MADEPQKQPAQDRDLAELADQRQPGLLREFWDFLRYNKKWWITPIVVVLLLVGVLVFLQGTVVAPFVYTVH